MSSPAILCVDSDPFALEQLTTKLQQILGEHYPIVEAEAGPQALELVTALQQQGRAIALVLMVDWLPDGLGEALLRHIDAEWPQTLTILIGSQPDRASITDLSRELRLYRYLRKPWQPAELQITVVGALQQYLWEQDRLLQQRELQQQNAALQRSLLELRQQAEQAQALNRAVQQLNQDLECQVQARTSELQQSLEFEALLKRITDNVRDSLDEGQILQTVVQALMAGLHTLGCDVALHRPEQGISVIAYEAASPDLPATISRTIPLSFLDKMLAQLTLGEPFQFCLIVPAANRPIERRFAILSCPILDDRTLLGDLWLFRPRDAGFLPLELRLVKQVANQCAIALRQSRLYQAAQMQVEELERLNRLKDDFLSSVSHELRSPMSNIKMATQMLELSLNRLNGSTLQADLKGVGLPAGSPATPAISPDPLLQVERYLQILKDECQRETDLINDLLDLARLEAGTEPLHLTAINLQNWLLHIAEPFMQRMQTQQQRFDLQLPSQSWDWITDLSSLERILTELLHNACKYTPAGETITLGATVVTRPSAERWLEIQLQNSGVEIPPQERDRIFEKFYRIPKNDPWKHGGTGLGLALVKRQVEQLQGRIEVQSRPGWTCFTLSLPQIEG